MQSMLSRARSLLLRKASNPDVRPADGVVIGSVILLIVVAGRVEGDLWARQSVELGPGAVVEGNLTTPRLATADGCRFDGRLEMPPRVAREEPADSPRDP